MKKLRNGQAYAGRPATSVPMHPQQLSETHLHSLTVESGIIPEVVVARGYRTLVDSKAIATLGQPDEHGKLHYFAFDQRRAPALGVPLWNTAGVQTGWQIRPDTPRLGKDGKPLKYESPAGSAPMLDISPLTLPLLGDPAVMLAITEGAKKIDAIVSAARREGIVLCGLNLTGVLGWLNNKYVLPAWRDVPLKERDVLLIFDSDVMSKPLVYLALKELLAFLHRREAKPRIVYLPQDKDGPKVGADDYLVQGHTMASMLDLAEPTLRPVTPQDLAEALLKDIEALSKAARSDEPIYKKTVLATFHALPWHVWAPIERRIKKLVPDISLNDLEKARSEAGQIEDDAVSEKASALADRLAKTFRETLVYDLDQQCGPTALKLRYDLIASYRTGKTRMAASYSSATSDNANSR